VFRHFPSNVSINGLVVAKGAANKLNVLKEHKIAKLETFQDLLKANMQDAVLKFLTTENLYNKTKNFRFADMLYLLKNKQFFNKTISILRER